MRISKQGFSQIRLWEPKSGSEIFGNIRKYSELFGIIRLLEKEENQTCGVAEGNTLGRLHCSLLFHVWASGTYLHRLVVFYYLGSDATTACVIDTGYFGSGALHVTALNCNRATKQREAAPTHTWRASGG